MMRMGLSHLSTFRDERMVGYLVRRGTDIR
jgi:hypothetical protein